MICFSRQTGWLLVLLLALTGTLFASGEAHPLTQPQTNHSAPPEIRAAKAPWQRIVMVGASVTAGFTESEMLGGTNTPKYRLSRYLDAALLVPHEPVQNLATALFFLQPEAAGRQQIDEAIEAKPTLLLGIDFLFWFCYGQGRSDKERLQRFDKGLKLLEAIKCPLVLGDIPDASAAVNGVTLSAEQVPSLEVMSAANQRLKEWAATRPQVIVLRVSEFMRTIMANETLTLHGRPLPKGTRALLQRDKLHPSAPGCAVLALSILDPIQSAQPDRSDGDIRWNPKEVFRLALTNSWRTVPTPGSSPGGP